MSSNGSIRVISFGDGRFNPLGSQCRQQLYENLQAAESDSSISSIILTGKGSNFSAGADLTEFDSLSTNNNTVTLVELVNYVEAFPKPIVAAIEGVALGGGMELALACHYRVASGKARMGLPEVTVGVIPGAGGTQRLPRLVGVQKSLSMILTGKPVSAQQAFDIGLVDAVADTRKQSVQECAATWADWARLLPLDDRRLSIRPIKENAFQMQSLFRAARRKLPPRDRGGESMHCALEAIEACASPNGMQREEELFYQALAKGQGQRHAFFAVRAAQKSKLAPPKQHVLLKAKPSSVCVACIGAGTMGSGIALVLLQAGYTVYLVDIQQEALQKGVKFLERTIQSMVTKKSLSESQASSLLSRLVPSQSLQDLSKCVLVVEAVVENLAIKQKIFSTLGQVTPPTALLLSNTSTLDINQMAAVLPPERQGYVAGWHFFSPAHRMKLVEIVVASSTSPETVALLQVLTKRIGKIGVTCGCCDGFVGNRMLAPYTSECGLLLAEGDATVESVDKALSGKFGMAMGPFAMSDLAGNDIGYFIRKEKGLTKDPETGIAPNRKPGMRYTDLGDDLVTKLGRVGQKAGKGWYDYNPKVGKGRKPLSSSEVASFVESYVQDKSKSKLASSAIVERVLFPLVNEGFKILDEGIVQKPSDIDVVYLYGYGWPAWKGGPMFWADNEIGLPHLLDRLSHFAREFPGSDYFKPSRLLQECVRLDMTVEEYYKRGMNSKAASKL